MKRDDTNYFIVGSVVLTALALLLYGLTKLTGGIGEHDPYHVFYFNVGGLKEGTPVTYEGFKIGKVISILPQRVQQRTRYRVNIMIRDGWEIPVGSRARIYSEGLLAETVINIEEGNSAELLPLGAEMEGFQNADLFSTVNTLAADVSQLLNNSVKPLLGNLNTNVSNLGSQMDQKLPVILNGIHELVQTLQNSAERLPEMLDKNSEAKIDTILENAQLTTDNLLTLSEALLRTQQKADVLLTESNGTIQDNRQDIALAVLALRHSLEAISAHTDGILQNLEGTSHNLNEFSRKIRQNPGLLLSSKPPTEVGITRD